jgi:hypothetical protein
VKLKRSFKLLVTLTALNTIGLLALVTWRVAESRHATTGQDLRAFYASLPPSELSLRFARPELYDGLDDFARPNALEEILRRRLLRRGMHVEAVRHVLGHADLSVTAEGSTGIRVGEAFDWHYDRLFASGLTVHFGADERVAKIQWVFEHPHQSRSRELE